MKQNFPPTPGVSQQAPVMATTLPPSNEAHVNLWVDRCVKSFFRHGSTILLTVMLLFVLVPFLAPVLMAFGWTTPALLIYQLYSFFCHQLPQRSWFFFGEKLTYTLDEIRQVYSYDNVWQLSAFIGTPKMGWKVAWSDRMLSFYTMTPIFGLFYGLRRYHLLKPISWKLLLLSLLPIFLDGITHLLNDLLFDVSGLGFRDTNAWLAFLTNGAFPGFYAGDSLGTFNWWLRLLTGLLAAWGIAAFIFPWLNRVFQEEAVRQPISPRQL